MGMKVAQKSAVRTFFKKIFKLTKKRQNPADGTSWNPSSSLDRDILFAVSRESGLNVLSGDDLDILLSSKKEKQQRGSEDKKEQKISVKTSDDSDTLTLDMHLATDAFTEQTLDKCALLKEDLLSNDEKITRDTSAPATTTTEDTTSTYSGDISKEANNKNSSTHTASPKANSNKQQYKKAKGQRYEQITNDEYDAGDISTESINSSVNTIPISGNDINNYRSKKDEKKKSADKKIEKKKNKRKNNKKAEQYSKGQKGTVDLHDDLDLSATRPRSHTVTSEQDLIDVDLDLVLSSFPNLTKSQEQQRRNNRHHQHNHQQHQQQQAENDNRRNEELCRTTKKRQHSSSRSIDDFPATTTSESPRSHPADDNNTVVVDIDCQHHWRQEEDADHHSVPAKMSRASYPHSSRQQHENWPRDNNTWVNERQQHKHSGAQDEAGKSKTKSKTHRDNNNANNTRQKSKQHSKRSKRHSDEASGKSRHGNVDNFTSRDRLLEGQECNIRVADEQWDIVVNHNVDNNGHLDNVNSDAIKDTSKILKKDNKKKKNRRQKGKKNKNARCLSDDVMMEVSEDAVSRRHQQVLYDSDLVIEHVSPDDHDCPDGRSKKKRSKRRRWKLNKNKLNSKTKRYDELTNRDTAPDDDDKTPMSSKEIGRRVWRACKTGWKYMKAGLIHYARAPATGVSLNPIVKRYDSRENNHFYP